MEQKACLTRPAVEFDNGAEEAKLEAERKLAQVIKRLRSMGFATDAILDTVPMPKEFVLDVLSGEIYRAVRDWDTEEECLRAELRRMRAAGFSEMYLEMYAEESMKGVWESRKNYIKNRFIRFSKQNTQPSPQDIQEIAEDVDISVERVLEIAKEHGFSLPAWV